MLRILNIETNSCLGLAFSKDSISLDKYYTPRKVIEVFGKRRHCLYLPKEKFLE
jgi:hypothetical protein